MSKCLYCAKETTETLVNGWHKSCIEHFFHSSSIPKIELNDQILENEVLTNLMNKKSITGVQKKMSFTYYPKRRKKMTLLNNPIGFILKPDSVDYPNIACAEELVMQMANISNIITVPHALIRLNNDELAYISKRIDIVDNHRVHMEDFCQLSFQITENKYHSSYEKCMKIIDRYSSVPSIDKVTLFERIVFSFIACNSDMHLKNISLIEERNGTYLSPAYDLLPVNLLVPMDLDETALSINGKNRNLHRGDFLKLAQNAGINDKVTKNIISHLCSLKNQYLDAINNSLLSDDDKGRFSKMVLMRIDRIAND